MRRLFTELFCEPRHDGSASSFANELDAALVRASEAGLCFNAMMSLMADRISAMSLAAGHPEQPEIPLAEVLAELPL
jgi:hypothetical protein